MLLYEGESVTMSNKKTFHNMEENREKAGFQKLSPGNFSYLDFILANNRTKPKVHFDLGSKNKAMLKVEETVKYTIGSKVPILITGEIGVGKTYLAKKIHKADASIDSGDLLLIDCKNSETGNVDFFKKLFGERNPSFDNIRTIVLKEIAFLDLTSQSYVLRFLQNYSESSSFRVPRLIVTSSKDIYELVEKGLFHQDLYYRLYILQLKVPALVEREDDLENILKELLCDMGKEEEFDHLYQKIGKFMEDKTSSFLEHNIESLKNFVKESISGVVSTKKTDEINFSSSGSFSHETTIHHWLKSIPKELTMRDIETHIILEVLKNNYGNRTHTARSLGISLRTLRNKINEYLQKGYLVTKPQK